MHVYFGVQLLLLSGINSAANSSLLTYSLLTKPSAILQMQRESKALPCLKQPITIELTAQAGLSHLQHKPCHLLFDQLSRLHRHNHQTDRTGL